MAEPTYKPEQLMMGLLNTSTAAGLIATYCDKVEHAEQASLDDLHRAAQLMCEQALGLAGGGKKLLKLYKKRIDGIERAKVGYTKADNFSYRIDDDFSWRDLQLLQMMHDQHYYADVVGMSKADQMRHYALHAAKLAGLLAQASTGGVPHSDLTDQRVPDLLLFALKIWGALNQKLPEDQMVADGAVPTY